MVIDKNIKRYQEDYIYCCLVYGFVDIVMFKICLLFKIL